MYSEAPKPLDSAVHRIEIFYQTAPNHGKLSTLIHHHCGQCFYVCMIYIPNLVGCHDG